MINESELTGELRGDFTELRVLQNGEFIDILSLIASNTSGVNDIQNGGGLAVSISNGVATITNTAQGSIGPPGNQGAQGERGFKGDVGDKGIKGIQERRVILGRRVILAILAILGRREIREIKARRERRA